MVSRLDRAGYDSVFMVALALIGTDVVLRCLMIEPNTQPQLGFVSGLDDETEPLLRNTVLPNHQTCRSAQEHHSDEEEGGALSNPVPASRIPPIVRLAMSGQLFVLLVASIVDAAIWTAFEAVCYSFAFSQLLFSRLNLTRPI